MRFDRCAWPLLAGSAGLFVLAALGSGGWLAAMLGSMAGLLALFFRDPERCIPETPGAFVSPADGVVTSVGINHEWEAGPFGGPQISIFLSVWNVHVNRVPHEGAVEKVIHSSGGHSPAWTPSASGNDSNWIRFRSGEHWFVVRQIAGTLARRPVCRVSAGEPVHRGQRLGIIKFGSRTDLYLPAGCQVLVRVGDKVAGGQSIVALLPEAGSGEKR